MIKFPFLLCLGLLVLLLFKNPFSDQNLISDLEPFPDTIYYLTPVKNLLAGQGFEVSYLGRVIKNETPPLYSLVILPFYLIFNDPRAFYFANIVLSLTSSFLFYKISTKLITNYYLKILIFLSFLTSVTIFWYPSIAMAENLLITLFLFSTWLIFPPLSLKKVLLLGALAVSFYATKYISFVVSLSLLAVILFQIYHTKIKTQRKIILFGTLLFSTLICLLFFNWLEYLNKGSYPLEAISINLFQLLTTSPSQETLAKVDQATTFSLFYIKDNFFLYLFGLIGGEVPVAGKNLSLLPILIGFLGLIGLVVNPWWGKFKLISFYFLLSTLGIIFLASYYFQVDGRYLFILTALLILSSGIFLDQLTIFLIAKKRLILATMLIVLSFIGVIVNITPILTSQLKTNFFIPEPALNYQTIKLLNNYFQATKHDSKPTVILTLPPYYVDFFSKGQYELLPLSNLQYFSDSPEKSWDIPPQTNLLAFYKQKLLSGTPLFVTDYQTAGYFYNLDYQKIKSEFNLTQVANGCQNKCHLYQLKAKN